MGAIISANRSRDFNVSNLLSENVLGATDLDLVLRASAPPTSSYA